MITTSGRRPFAAGAAGLALALTVSACGVAFGGSGDLEKTTVTVGALPIVDFAALWFARDKGLFKKQGLNVNISIQSGGATAIPQLAAGTLDFTVTNYVSAIQATQSGSAPLKVLCDAYQLTPGSSGVVVPKDSRIKKPSDLKGKKIAVNTKDNVGQLLVTAGLRAHHVATSPDQFSVLDFPQMSTALDTKSVDAAWVVEPFVTQIKQDGGRMILDVGSRPTANFPIGSYVTSKKFARDDPHTTAAFTTAITQAQAMLAKNEKLVREILPTYATIGTNAANTIKLASYPTGVNKDQTQKVADLMTKYGFLKSHYDVSPML